MSIGENIKDMRQRKEWTQRELAERVGIGQSMIAQIERGTKTVTMPLGKQIAEVFGCTLDDLFNDVRSVSNGR